MPYRRIPRKAKIPLSELESYRRQRMENIEHAGDALVQFLRLAKNNPAMKKRMAESIKFGKKSLLESSRDLARVGGLNTAELEVLRRLNRAINAEDPDKLATVIGQYTCLPKNVPKNH